MLQTSESPAPPVEPIGEAPTPATVKKKKNSLAGLVLSKTAFLVGVCVVAAVVLVMALINQKGGSATIVNADPSTTAANIATRQSSRKTAAQIAANDTVSDDPGEGDSSNSAFPDGTANRNAARTPAPHGRSGDPIIRRNVREPNTHTVAKETSPAKKPQSATAAAGMPELHSNGQQPLKESLGKTRRGTFTSAGTQQLIDQQHSDEQRSTLTGSTNLTPAPATADSDDKPKLEDEFAPYGRLVKCELVFTVDSINMTTPIVGIVMEDVWWNGKLIIPAKTEVFSKAIPNHVLNRIGDDGRWVFVLPEENERINGRELVLRGFALDRAEVEVEPKGRVRSWSLNDGSAGLQGFVVDETNQDKMKLFLATALSGAVQGVSNGIQPREAVPGVAGALGMTEPKATLENAGISGVGGGAKASLDLLAKQIMDEINQHGSYIRVPAGKSFYIFIDQSIDPLQAAVGKRLSNEK